jgi:hypothetical protein
LIGNNIMKKYKLIQKYPSLARDWEPGMEVGTGDRNYGYSPCSGNYTDCRKLDNNEVENNPEFWQEVVDHEFEIISFKQDSGVTDLWTKFREGWSRNVNGYPVTGPYSTEAILENPLYKIHSVKRISDGEIFTVGDRTKTITSQGSHNIRQFRIEQKCTGRNSTDGWNYDGIDRIWIDWEENCGGNWLESTEKAKNPIFLTHDGEDIFEGDKVWWVRKDSTYYDSLISVPWMQFYSNLNAYFLTEEAALNYINKNKVLFTTEDGVDIKHGDTYYFVDTDFNINTSKANFQAVAMSDEKKYFSTVEQAHEYVMQNVKALSIKDFWEITCMSTSNFNKSTYMRDLVKKALGIK